MARADVVPGEGWEDREWFGGGALHLVRPEDHCAIVALFAESGALDCWYVNLQLPYKRSSFGVETMDLILDVVVAPDLSGWAWKDEDQFEDAITRGIFDSTFASGIRAAGLDAVERLDAESDEFSQWQHWTPPPDWELPTLPGGWDSV